MGQDIIDYISNIDVKYRDVYIKLMNIVADAIPEGFELQMLYDMPTYVVPKSRYPQGYHVKPEYPLPFLSLGVQKGHIGIYHLGIYMDPQLLAWFEKAYAETMPTKLDMGKSCIRLKNPNTIPFDLIADLVQQVTVDEYIDRYESNSSR
ncbi:DUF1801 domain-containing protein [Erysipelothrix sp. HDW6C]|uniref:DUF1801 domain-containing protein n=1 Tax=Erysipelothrix sp. HDW6C TaxID=2714930 RepID=UPI0014086B8E|nr:DUF1801 domain-containing protein [Erysipelothrix sp. HDW6C]QIK70012.1 DUF1801 domain-containing protein [Erysipelothrix sp. HDW6C]